MELFHVRLVCPPDLTAAVLNLLTEDRCVFNVITLPERARDPDGDAVECDVLAGAANEMVEGLRRLRLEERGSLLIDPVELAFSSHAARAESQHLRGQAHAPLWAEVESRIRAEGTYLPRFYVYLAIAGLIGAVGIITNSQILIVAAMVVGPEYGAISSVALAIDRRHRSTARDGLTALVSGFLLAVVCTFLFALLVRACGFQPAAFELGIRPVSDLINTPNFFSLTVALLAGVIGIVSQTQARTSALLGVFISVTTIPAAADIGVSCAFTSWDEARGSLLQLLLNIVVLILTGAATLRFQRAIWRAIGERTRGRYRSRPER